MGDKKRKSNGLANFWSFLYIFFFFSFDFLFFFIHLLFLIPFFYLQNPRLRLRDSEQAVKEAKEEEEQKEEEEREEEEVVPEVGVANHGKSLRLIFIRPP